MNQPSVNSKDYWEHRFATNWDEAGGIEQTTFFAETALRLLPDWLLRELAAYPWRFADVGCAEGEAAAYVKTRFPNLDVVGLDFSETAIATARSRHTGIRFEVADLGKLESEHDVLFCSNVLEHFREPYPLLERMASLAGQYLIVVVPGWEFQRHHEHHVTFDLSRFPAGVGPLVLANVAAINCSRVDVRQWPGYQIVAVYGKPEALERAGATAADLVAAAALPTLTNLDLMELSVSEPAMLAHVTREGNFGSAEALMALPAKIDALQQRQEAIGYNTRMELQSHFDAAFAGLASAPPWASLLKDATSQFEGLKRAVADAIDLKEAAANFGRVVAEKNEEVERLRAASRRKEEAMEKAIEEAKGEVEHLRATLHGKEEMMVDMKETIDSLAQQIAVLTSELSAARRSSATDIAHLRAECDGLRAAVTVLENDRARFVSLAGRYRQHLADVHASSSWRASAPLRWLKAFLSRTAVAAPIEFLPSPVVVSPQPQSTPVPMPAELGPASLAASHAPILAWQRPNRDLTWEEFNEHILSCRQQYKGVFIQETVIDWDVPLFQRPQHIASAFGRLGYLALYKTINWTNDDVNGFREVAPNVWLTNSPQVDSLDGVVRSMYSTAYADDPQNFTSRSAGSVMVYEYIDHIDPQISGDEENIRRLLRLKDWAFSGGADVVVASAKVLHAEAVDAIGETRTILAQNGVDTRHYRDPGQANVAVPQSLHDFRGRFRTIVGYFGAIAPWLWYDAITDLVRNRPDVGFVFIGPDYYGGVERLPRAENVLYLGSVDYRVLPGHARFFDVCFIPFEPGEIAKTTSPLKLFEYFALEKPVVVTTDMLECVAHPEVFKGRSAAEFSDAINAAVAVKDDPAFRQRLAKLADENDWDRRAEAYAAAFRLLESKAS